MYGQKIALGGLIVWRILKINNDNELVLVSDKPLTSLAFNPSSDDYLSSDINKWMNSSEVENTGILEGQLNNKAKLSKERADYLEALNIMLKDAINKLRNDMEDGR